LTASVPARGLGSLPDEPVSETEAGTEAEKDTGARSLQIME